MEEELKSKPKHNKESVSETRLKEAERVSNKIRGKYSGMVASTLVQHSFEDQPKLILTVVIDDLNNTLLDQTVADVRLSVSEMAYEGPIQMTGEVILASQFWKGVRNKDSRTLDVIRNSLVVHDNGFFYPIQDLLVNGKMRPSRESVRIYFMKSDKAIKNANEHVAKAIIDLYWAVTDAAHSAVMTAGITPPSPKELSSVVNDVLVRRNLVHPRCVEIISNVYTVAKKIMHKQQFEFTGREYDKYLEDVDFFIQEMNDFVKTYAK